MGEDNLNNRVEAVKHLLAAFRLERTVYLIISTASVVLVFVLAGWLFCKGSIEGAESLGLFGCGGTITYSTGRLLRMWSDAMRILGPVVSENKE